MQHPPRHSDTSWKILNWGSGDAYLRSIPDVSAIDVRALGPFEADVDGASVELGSRIQQCVLALLTASFGETVSADRIISEIWGESPPAKPSQSLQTYVSNLRRLLGRESIETRHTGYRLRVSQESIDVEQFRNAFSASAASDGNPTEVESTLERALSLWRGTEPYQSLADEVPLLREESTRLKEMRLTSIERLYDVRLQLGKHAEVIPELQVLTTEHPFRERVSALLMKALYATGRQAEALGVYRDLRTRLVEELGIEPSPDLQELEIRILAQTEKVHTTPGRRRSRLPYYPTEFVGRDDDLESLRVMLGDHRIVTVTGPAGVGKTRMGVEVGHQLIETHSDGVFFADLSTIDSGADIAKAVMAGSGLGDQSMSTPQRVVSDFLADREAILILDNCEHVASTASDLVWEWVIGNPELTVLSTSRQPLGLTGEKVFALTPLPTDTPGQESPSARLFLQRAAETDPGFQPSEQERQLIEEICRRLDGIPLAIELAAARLQTLALKELNDALDERLHLLSSKGGEPDRHTALLESLDWSFNLLDAGQQSLFECLSVINGSFSLEVAGAVGGIESSTVVIDLVDHLVNCSLIQRDRETQRSHFRMLETMRLFGRARLEEHGRLDSAEEHRAEYFAVMAVEQAQLMKGYGHLEAVATITSSLDNMRPAFMWALDKERFDLAFSLTRPLWALVFVGARRHLHEGQEWRERLAGLTTDLAMKARLLGEAAFASFVLGDQRRAMELAEESLSISDTPSSRALALEALALCAATNRETAKATALAEAVLELNGDEYDAHGLEALAFAQIFGGNPAAAVDTVERVFEAADRRGDPLRHIRALALMGAALQGTDLDRSRGFLDEAVARTEELGMEWDLAGAVMARSLTNLMAGRIPDALDDLERAAALTYDVGDNRRLAQTIEILGSILARVGQAEEAVEMLSAAQELRRSSDVIGSEDEEERRLSALTELEAALDAERFSQAMARGRAASPGEASTRAVGLAKDAGAQLKDQEVRHRP